MRTRRRFTAEFKAKVALEALSGQRTITELATRHELRPNLITQRKRQAIEKLAKVFDDKGFEVRTKRVAAVGRSSREHLSPSLSPATSPRFGRRHIHLRGKSVNRPLTIPAPGCSSVMVLDFRLLLAGPSIPAQTTTNSPPFR